jgi:hypothetical protein
MGVGEDGKKEKKDRWLGAVSVQRERRNTYPAFPTLCLVNNTIGSLSKLLNLDILLRHGGRWRGNYSIPPATATEHKPSQNVFILGSTTPLHQRTGEFHYGYIRGSRRTKFK